MNKEQFLGITKIAVKGFKSIVDECEIDIRPLTILAGANSSGKSSIMQPLLMLKQTLEAPYDPGPLLIDGPNVRFTEAEQFLSKFTDKQRTDRFQIGTGVGDVGELIKTTFKKEKSSEFEIVEMVSEMPSETDQSFAIYPKHCTLYPGMSPKEIKKLGDHRHQFVRAFDVVGRSRCFLRLESKDGIKIVSFANNVEIDIFNTIHLPGLRGNPERTYKLSSTGPRYPGTFEHYVASIIHEWQETHDKRLTTLLDTLYILELTGRVNTKKIGDVGVEVQVGRLPYSNTSEDDMVNIADVGFGVSQVLPVLVALIAAEPGRLVYIEQPELHLHPNAQVALSQILADAAKRGVRVVIETHSSLLLLGIQTLVAEGKLPPELVKLHWFSRTKEGVTKVNSKGLDKDGTYGRWPVDFDKVNLREQSRYIKASRMHDIEGI